MIKPPKWATEAMPTSEGWVNRVTGELLVRAPGPSNFFTEEQIDEYDRMYAAKKYEEGAKKREEERKAAELKMKEAEEAQKVSVTESKKTKKKSVKRKNK